MENLPDYIAKWYTADKISTNTKDYPE